MSILQAECRHFHAIFWKCRYYPWLCQHYRAKCQQYLKKCQYYRKKCQYFFSACIKAMKSVHINSRVSIICRKCRYRTCTNLRSVNKKPKVSIFFASALSKCHYYCDCVDIHGSYVNGVIKRMSYFALCWIRRNRPGFSVKRALFSTIFLTTRLSFYTSLNNRKNDIHPSLAP